MIEPNIQIIARALENAKYCVEEETLRNMFSSLIASSMNNDFSVSPLMITIISSLSPIDAKILEFYFIHYKNNSGKAKFIIESHIDNIDDAKKIMGDSSINLDELKKHLNTSNTDFVDSIIELV